jgi:hypothetical protein
MKNYLNSFTFLLIGSMILLLTGQGLAKGLVLCIGEGDHFALEQAFTGKCKPVEAPCHEETELSCGHDHCGPCQDIEASINSLHGRSRGDQEFLYNLHESVLSAFIPFTFTAFFRDLIGNLFAQPPPPSSHPLLALRTIVLLI